MRRAARTDENQREIVEYFRKVGCSVVLLHQVGEGCPDILVGYGDAIVLVEIKTKTGKLTEQQKRFAETFQPGFYVVRDLNDASNLHKNLQYMSVALKTCTEVVDEVGEDTRALH